MPRRSHWYILNDDRTVSPVKDVRVWAAWMSKSPDQNRVAFTDIGRNGNRVEVSTVFLGIDNNFSGEGQPILFETMIFGGQFDHEMWRCSTFDEALVQHAQACDVVRGKIALFRRRLR